MKGAGLEFVIDPADIDETALKLANADFAPDDIASYLAREKAMVVSKRHSGALVIGADQTMTCDGVSFDKPTDLGKAREHLKHLRGRAHTLHSAVCLVRNQKPVWSTRENAYLTMRDFDDEFLASYLAEAGETVLTSVGCYRLEGLGAHLFEKIDGDFFTILGLPLLPLLGYLREAEILH